MEQGHKETLLKTEIDSNDEDVATIMSTGGERTASGVLLNSQSV
ncbi:MAG: hypothetical protein WA172_11915 [Terriglobales bacterium]